MRAAILAVIGVLAAAPAFASDKTDVMATVKAYAAAFNKNDMAAASAMCAAPAVVIDDFAPHVWQGATACADWAAANAAAAMAAGDTDAAVAPGKPLQLSVTGDRAYAVLPTKYTYKEHGKLVAERGIWTFALQKIGADWRIAGWAWGQE